MAHIMTYKELCQLDIGDTVYEEFKDNEKYKLLPLTFNGTDLTTDGKKWLVADHYLTLGECDEDCLDYNWNYRVWNDKPTEEEMKTPWRDNPYE